MRQYSKSAIYLTLSEVLVKVFLFLANVYLARTLGSDGFGMIVFGFSFLIYPTMLGNFGIDLFGHIESGKEKHLYPLGYIFASKFYSNILILVIFSLGVLLFVKDSMSQNILQLFLLNIISESLFVEWFFKGKKKFLIVAIIKTASYILYTAFIFLFVKSLNDLYIVPLIFMLSNLIISLFLLGVSFKTDFVVNFKITIKNYMSIIKSSFLLGIGNILSRLIPAFPPLIIVALVDFSSTGYFGAAYRILGVLLILDRVLINIYLSYLPSLWEKQKDKMKRVLQDTFNTSIALGTIISFSISINADNIMTLVFGNKYNESIVLLEILSWFFMLTMVNSVFIVGLICANLNKLYFKISLWAFVINIISIALLTYFFGVKGACLGTIVAEVLLIMLAYWSSKKYLAVKVSKTVIIVSLMIVFSYVLNNIITDRYYLNNLLSILVLIIIMLLSNILNPKLIFMLFKKGN